jgi:hypothetical protein
MLPTERRAAAAPVPVLVEPPLRWISPNAIGSAALPPAGMTKGSAGGLTRPLRWD